MDRHFWEVDVDGVMMENAYGLVVEPIPQPNLLCCLRCMDTVSAPPNPRFLERIPKLLDLTTNWIKRWKAVVDAYATIVAVGSCYHPTILPFRS